MYNCKSIVILNEIISLCRTQQELNTVNMLINHSFLLYWRPRNLIREFCIYLQESWKPHLPNSLTMGSKDTSRQEQQREAKWKRQRRKLCFCARCKGLHSCILDKGHLKVHQAGWHSHEIIISKWKCCIWLSLTISYNCQFQFAKNITPHIHIWCICKGWSKDIITTPDMTRNRCKPWTIFRSFIAMIKHRKDHLW